MSELRVSTVLVTLNSLGYLPECFDALANQEHPASELVVVDNGSTDGSVEWIREHVPGALVIPTGENLGFARANNLGIARTTGELVFLLNTDVVLEPDYIARIATRFDRDERLGSAAGKLLKLRTRGQPVQAIDSAGEAMLVSRRMINLGEEEADRGQYDDEREVFGVTAAAAIYRRAMLEDTRLAEGEFLDASYFSYLEDCDLNWRARLRGWRSLRVPTAVAFHARQHAARWPLAVRRHALANRYLTILKNESAWNLLLALPHLAIYDTYLLARTLLREPGALLGLSKVLRLLPGTLARRRRIRSRTVVSSRAMRAWAEPEGYGERLASVLRGGRPWRRVTREGREACASTESAAQRDRVEST